MAAKPIQGAPLDLGGAPASQFDLDLHVYALIGKLERQLTEARAGLNHVIAQYGGMVPDEGCDCDDCRFIKPVYKALGLTIPNIKGNP